MMRTITGLLLALLAGLSATGCSDLGEYLKIRMSDPAVRLAYCFEASANKLASTGDSEVSHDCDLGLQGHYVVVLYPAKNPVDSDFGRVGISDRMKESLGRLRLGPHESIYVIPTEKQGVPSRTTYRKRFVTIPELMAIEKDDDDVSVILRKTPDGIVVVGMK